MSKVAQKFEKAGNADELFTFLNRLLVQQEFGSVGVVNLMTDAFDDVIGVVFDKDDGSLVLVTDDKKFLFDNDK